MRKIVSSCLGSVYKLSKEDLQNIHLDEIREEIFFLKEKRMFDCVQIKVSNMYMLSVPVHREVEAKTGKVTALKTLGNVLVHTYFGTSTPWRGELCADDAKTITEKLCDYFHKHYTP
ncbi:MAG: hypothetical protein HUK20_13125 [Fibrobacter sp.]|nr:hypothetical protein [Fibrobacter sp.]